MCDVEIQVSFSKFADDTSLLLSSDTELYDKQITTELKKVMGWFSCNKLLLNYSKSQYIFFGPLYPTQYVKEFLLKDLYDVCPQYLLQDEKSYDSLDKQLTDNTLKRAYINGDPILKELSEVAPHYLLKEHIITDSGILVEESEVKYLGILFDNFLTFNSHIGSITDKISKVVGILWKARSLPLKIKLKIYCSLIYTHINYAILIWGSEISRNITRGITGLEHIPKSLKNLNTVHNKSVRALVCTRKRDPLSKIFRELNLLKLVDIYYYNLGTFAYDTFVENSPKYFINYPISHNRIPNTITRSRSKTPNAFDFTCGNIFYKQPKSKKTLNSISYAAAALWNKLPLALNDNFTKLALVLLFT